MRHLLVLARTAILPAIIILLASCGDSGGSTTIDAAVTTDATGNDAGGDAAACAEGMADHPAFWATLCDAAEACGWLTSGHAELEFDEASCNVRHATDPDPSTQAGYLAAFETRIHAAAACLGCQSLLDAYFTRAHAIAWSSSQPTRLVRASPRASWPATEVFGRAKRV